MPFGLSSGFDVAELGRLSAPGVTQAIETRGAPMTFQVRSVGLQGAASFRFEGSLDGESWFNLATSGDDETITTNGCFGYSLTAPVRYARFRATSVSLAPRNWEFVGDLAYPASYQDGPFRVVQGALYDYRINIDWTAAEDGRTSVSDLAVVSRWGGLVFVETVRQIGTGQPLQQVLYGDGERLVDFVFPNSTNDSLVGEGSILAQFRQTGFSIPPVIELHRSPRLTSGISCLVGCS
jgi:hypothetical protein